LRRDSHPLPSRSAPNLAVGRSGAATGSHRIWQLDAQWLDPAAQIAHYSLYVLLVAVPVVGVVLQFARGDALPLFGLAEIPSPWLKDRALAHSVKEVHEILAHALVVLAAFHAAAALIHHWVFRDRTLVRMLPHSNK
jgi:cytochrome b561